MDIIDGELQRTDQYRDQLTKRKKGGDGMADPVKLQQDYERNLKKYQAVVAKQDQVGLGSRLLIDNIVLCLLVLPFLHIIHRLNLLNITFYFFQMCRFFEFVLTCC